MFLNVLMSQTTLRGGRASGRDARCGSVLGSRVLCHGRENPLLFARAVHPSARVHSYHRAGGLPGFSVTARDITRDRGCTWRPGAVASVGEGEGPLLSLCMGRGIQDAWISRQECAKLGRSWQIFQCEHPKSLMLGGSVVRRDKCLGYLISHRWTVSKGEIPGLLPRQDSAGYTSTRSAFEERSRPGTDVCSRDP